MRDAERHLKRRRVLVAFGAHTSSTVWGLTEIKIHESLAASSIAPHVTARMVFPKRTFHADSRLATTSRMIARRPRKHQQVEDNPDHQVSGSGPSRDPSATQGSAPIPKPRGRILATLVPIDAME